MEKKNKILKSCVCIDKKVTFEGFKQREELIELLKKSDIFIIPSRQDCFGLVINEVMCAGLPIIASKYVDGAYDLIKEDEGGYIIDPYDENTFKQAIESMFINKEKSIQMGMFNKFYIKNFLIENLQK